MFYQDLLELVIQIVSFFSSLWSKLTKSNRDERDILVFKDNLKLMYKPKKQKHFNYGDKWANTLLCRLRVGRSFLKSNGFQINLSNTDRCWCGEEDRTNFFSVILPIPGRKKRNACKSRINSSKLRKTK